MMVEKRGIVVQQLLIALLAIFFLVFMILLFTRAQTGHWIPDFIPGFNQTGTGRAELALVRYSISEDRIDYYDGANWRVFGDAKRQFNAPNTFNKVYDGAILKKEIREHYFDPRGQIRKPEDVEFYDLFEGYYFRISDVMSQSYEEPRKWSKDVLNYFSGILRPDVFNYILGTVQPLRRGDVLLELWKHGGTTESGQLQELYVLRGVAGEILRISRSGNDFFDGKTVARELVRRKSIAWRESVLQKPMRITYALEKGEEKSAFVCLIRTTGTEDLVADLDKEVDADASCGAA